MRQFDKLSGQLLLYSPANLDLLELVETSQSIIEEERIKLLKKKKKSGELFNLTRCYIILTKIKWGELIQKSSHDFYRHWVYLKN